MAKSNLRRIGTVIGTAFTLFTTNWNPVVSALLALGAAGWAYATQWGYLAVVAIAFAIFTTFVWLINGIIWFNRRNEVQTVRPEADISYALAYVGSNLGFNDTNPDATVQIGINFANTSRAAIWYTMEQFDVVIVNRTLPNPNFTTFGGLLSPGISRHYRYPAFSRNDIKDFLGKNSDGSVTFSVRYGPAGKAAARRLRMKLSISLRLDEKFALTDSILSESDDII